MTCPDAKDPRDHGRQQGSPIRTCAWPPCRQLTRITNGTVTKIDTKWSKVTVDHEEPKNLDRPATKIVFQAAEPEMLEKPSEGESIQFAADRVNGKLTITEILK